MKRKIVVFDMDKTIGDFDMISFLYANLKMYTSIYKILDEFFDCFRPNIFNIFYMLHEYKLKCAIEKIVLYTNNTGGVVWAKNIIDYIHYKLKFILFDDLITGLYVNKHDIPDYRRTSIEKTYIDLQHILKLDQYSLIIFVDDVYHHTMSHTNVKYIQISPYNYCIDNETLLTKLKNIQPHVTFQIPRNINNCYNTYNENITKQLFDALSYYITV